MRASRLTSPLSEGRRPRPPDLEDLTRPVHSPPPSEENLSKHCQSPKFRRIKVLVDEEAKTSPLGSPLSSRRNRSRSYDSRDSTPDPPTYREVLTGSPNIVNQTHFDFPPLITSTPTSKVHLFRKTEVYAIETASEGSDNTKNGDMDLNSNFPERETGSPSNGLRTCPGGDHDHRLCRQQLDDLHAQLQAMMSDSLNGGDTPDSAMVSNGNEYQSSLDGHSYQGNSTRETHYQRNIVQSTSSVHSSTIVREEQERQRYLLLQQQQQQQQQLQMSPPSDLALQQSSSYRTDRKMTDEKPYPSGPCTCCPYGYHIDLTFLGIFDQNENDHLDRLIQIRKNKKRLRKSMEIYLQQNEDYGTEEGDCLMNLMEEDEEATRVMLHEIDSSVDATIASIDHLIQTGKEARISSMPELDESEMSISSGPQNTSSPKPNGALNRRPSNDSLSSLDTSTASEQNAKLLDRTDASRSTTTTTTSSHITTITSQQIAVNMANCFDVIRNESSEDMVAVTPEQLRRMREQIALSLQKMKELEEQVKAIPVLQVRISVLKEEKRLLALQNEAKNKRMSKSYRSIGVGDHTIDEVPSRSRSRSQSPSFEMSDFASIRRGRRTPLPGEKPSTEEMGTGEGDVRNLYYLQPDLISQEEFIETAKILLPEHIKVKVNDDAEEEEPLFFSSRITTEEQSPWDEIDSPGEFTRLEKALEADSAARFFAKPEDKPTHPESDSGDETTTITTTKTTKIYETEYGPQGVRGQVIRVPEIIRQHKPFTRDFGQTYNEAKPRLVDVSVGVGENMDVVSKSDDESDYDEYGRKIVTTTTVTRKNLLLQEQRVKMALREALHREVKSVGVNVRFSTNDQSTLTEFIKTNEVGCSNDTIDVTVKPNVWLRSMGTEVKPQVSNHSTWTDKRLCTETATNTPTVSQQSKTTSTNKALSFPAATNTEGVSTYTVGCETDQRTLYAMNLINNRGVNTYGLCTCGPGDDSEIMESEEVAATESAPGDESSSTTKTTTRKRVITYETNPINVSITRDIRLGSRSPNTSRSTNRTDTEFDSETSTTSSRFEIDRIERVEIEPQKLTTYERFYPVQPQRSTRIYSSTVRSKPDRSSPGDSLLVKRVKSHGHNLPIFGTLHRDPVYSDCTDLGTFMSTVSTSNTMDIGPGSDAFDKYRVSTVSASNSTFDIGPGSDVTDRSSRTVTASGYSSSLDYPRGHVIIERTTKSSSSTDTDPFVDIVDQGSPTKLMSQSDIFGNESSSTIIRKSKETSSSTSTTVQGEDCTDSSPKRKSRRAKLDGASMLSGTPSEAPIQADSNLSLFTDPVLLHRTQGGLSLSSDTDIPLARKLGSTDLTSGNRVTVTSSSTSSVSTYSSSTSLGPDGMLIERVNANSKFSSSQPGQRPTVDLKSEVEKLASQSILDPSLSVGLTSMDTSAGQVKTQGGVTEFRSDRHVHTIDGQGTVKEESMKKVDGEVVEHETKEDSFTAENAPPKQLSLPDLDTKLGVQLGSSTGSSSGDSQLASSSVTSASSARIGSSGSLVTSMESPDMKLELEKFSSGLLESGLSSGLMDSGLFSVSGGQTTSKTSVSFQSSVSSSSSTDGQNVKEFSSSREMHSVDGKGTVKEETIRKEDGEVLEHTVKSDSFNEPTTTGSMGTISIGRAQVVKPVVKPLTSTNVRFLRTRSSEGSSPDSPDSGKGDSETVKPKSVTSPTSPGAERSSRIPTLHSEKTLSDFKQESAKLKSRLLKTEAVLGNFSASAASADESLLISNKHAESSRTSGSRTVETSTTVQSLSSPSGSTTTVSNEKKVDGVTVESTSEKKHSGKTSPHKTSPKQPKSIMKKSGAKKEKHAGKKAIKFAAGTVGGKRLVGERYVSTSSDSDSDSDTSDTSSGSDSSFEEGSYDGREGKITFSCQDDMARAKDAASLQVSQESAGRETFEMSATSRKACERVTDYLLGRNDVATEVWNESLLVLQDEWFRVAGQRLANPAHVESYLASLRAYSTELQEKIVNLVDGNGNTCLHYAVSYCNFETLSLLLKTRVCDVNKTNKAGYTPIMLASLAQVQMDRQKEILRLLFREGNVNMKASQAGQTALMLAVSHGRKEMVKLLLDCGSDINAQDDDGSTALMCACEHGHADIVKVLLAQPECNATLVDNDGSTALSIAMESGHRDIAVLLYAKLGIKKSGSPVTSPLHSPKLDMKMFHRFRRSRRMANANKTTSF